LNTLSDTGNLSGLLAKLKKNRDKVPLETLKTKYKQGYDKLLAEIKAEAENVFLPIALKGPAWLEGAKLNSFQQEKLTSIMVESYKEAGGAKKIGHALFTNYSIEEAQAAAEEVNKVFLEHLEAADFFNEGTGLFITEPCWKEGGPAPKIYNEFIDRFWDEDTGDWRAPRPGEAEEEHGFWYNSFCKLLNEWMKKEGG